MIYGHRLINPRGYFFSLVIASLCLMASLVSSNIAPDTSQYFDYFDMVVHGNTVAVETTFYYVSILTDVFFSSPYFIFFFYSTLAVAIKTWLIVKHSPYIILSLIVYCSFFFIVQDSNMIRAGLATSFVAWAFFSYVEKKYFNFLIISIIATLFHNSCFVSFLLPIVISREERAGFRRSVVYISLCIFFALTSDTLGLQNNFLKLFGSLDPTGRIDIYTNFHQNNMYSNLNFTNKLLPAFTFIMPILVVYYKACKESRYFSGGFQLLCFGVFVFSFLSPLPVLAYRFSEIFLVFSIFVFPFISLFFKGNGFGYVSIYLFFVVNFVYLVFIKGYYNLTL